ncbi:MAG: hypothetical protein ABIQ31_20380 [Ferruginibacter sp.]
MESLITQAQDKITRIEKNDHMIEKTLFDYIIKDNGSLFSYEYYFFKTNSYTITAIGDDSKLLSVTIKILKKGDDGWQVVKKTLVTSSTDLSLLFTPTESKRYKIQLECTYKSGYTESCFGLIVDREI